MVVVFTELSILVFREMQKLFLNFRAPHKEQDRTCCLARYSVIKDFVIKDYGPLVVTC